MIKLKEIGVTGYKTVEVEVRRGGEGRERKESRGSQEE